MTSRIRCLVPFCRRTRRNEWGVESAEWVCGPHWSGVPKKFRNFYTAAKRRFRRDRSERNFCRCERAWNRCKAAAMQSGDMVL